MSHTIRLRGPWSLRHESLATPMRFKVPGSLPDLEAADSVEIIRNFNRPTGIDDRTSVCLCCRLHAEIIALSVNGTEIDLQVTEDSPSFAEIEGDVTKVLQNANEIVLTCKRRSESQPIVVDEVWIQIEHQ